MEQNGGIKFSHWSTATVFFLSVVVIAFQLSLIRSMSVLRYYHFSYLVISTALLGFGASGTFLTFAYGRMKQKTGQWISVFFILLVISIPLCYVTATSLPLDVRFVFFSGEQLGYLLLYNLLLFIPFFWAAVIIGFLLTYFKKRVPSLYGANLLGSGTGALVAIGLMFIFPSVRLPLLMGALSWIAYICWFAEVNNSGAVLPRIGLAVTGLIALGALLYQHEPSVDPYKTYRHFKDLEQQGDAEHILTVHGPRARVDVFDSRSIHHTLFAGIQADTTPPPQMAVLLDAQMAGYMFKVEDTSQTRILDFVPQSLPYRLIERPKVLLLGEISGVNIWLAERFGASEITAVQTNPRLLSVLVDSLAEENGGIFRRKDVEVFAKHPRLFLEQTDQHFDIIQFVSAESMPSGSGGLQGLHEDYLLTTDAFRTALDRLTPNGVLSLTRGMQSPARDNIKIFATLYESIDRAPGDSVPYRRLFQSRNYLAVQNMLRNTPAPESFISRYKTEAAALGMDIEFAGGFPADTSSVRNIVDGPRNGTRTWYREAAQAILSGRQEDFYDQWVYNIRPPTDKQPYFHDFFKWSSLPRFIEQYGGFWFRKIELGYGILALTFIELSVAGFVLILLPLLMLRSDFSTAKNTLPSFLYFGALGIGFMFLEMVYIQQFTKFMGDPIFSVSAALTAILVSSGIGSSLQSVLPGTAKQRIRVAATAIALIAMIYLIGLDRILDGFIGQETPVRFIITVLFLFLVSFFMGWMFPNGMALLREHSDRLVPWAWGVNGFLSVAASPLAVMVSMSAGFDTTVLSAIGCYGLAFGTTYLWNS